MWQESKSKRKSKKKKKGRHQEDAGAVFAFRLWEKEKYTQERAPGEMF